MIHLAQRLLRRAGDDETTEDAGPMHERGFTLIELMVVVLIIAILLAIAIPTFLGSRNTANARSMQSNLRNALTAEQTNWTNTQNFATAAVMTTIEPSLNWTSTTEATTEGGNTVFVTVWGTGTIGANQQVVLQGYAKDGNCYEIFQSDDPTLSMTAYDESKGGCALPVQANIPTAVATAPGNGVIGAAGTYSWNTSW
jgi:type IV pilus assembly protein PilA